LALLFLEPFAQTGHLALWRLDESREELARQFRGTPEELAEYEALHHPQKQLEFLASRALARAACERLGYPYAGLRKDAFGKPHLREGPLHLSLTHCTTHAAVVLHPTQPVGIDLEPLREQLRRVVPRVLTAPELDHAAGDLHRLGVYWCAKEALYKLHGRGGITLRHHLFIEPFADGASAVQGWIRPDQEDARAYRVVVREVAGVLLAVAGEAG
jgi:4'-phosphopantetheinyl transferase